MKKSLLVGMREVKVCHLAMPDAAHSQDEVRPLHVREVVDRMYGIRPLEEVCTQWIQSSGTMHILEAQLVICLN